MDFSRIGEIIPKPISNTSLLGGVNKGKATLKPVSDFFQDNSEVPPLE